jgi:hypothetical protein
VREAGEAWALVARRFGVSHVLFPTPRTERGRAIASAMTQGGRPLLPDPRADLQRWEVPHRAWVTFAEAVELTPDAASSRRSLMGQAAAPGAERVLLESAEPHRVAAGRVVRVARSAEHLEVLAEAEGPATLVVNDAWWPGWRATIDGQEVPISPADALVRAVPFPAGRHTLEMRYEPREVSWGARLSLAALVLLLVLAALLSAGQLRASDRTQNPAL